LRDDDRFGAGRGSRFTPGDGGGCGGRRGQDGRLGLFHRWRRGFVPSPTQGLQQIPQVSELLLRF
ncbi:MAG: hypothetical protein EBZ53_04035, partial [Verrucomicrobia bacterium]|nr:hypothetical protein [Verrucomicrobiota bacterium]